MRAAIPLIPRRNQSFAMAARHRVALTYAPSCGCRRVGVNRIAVNRVLEETEVSEAKTISRFEGLEFRSDGFEATAMYSDGDIQKLMLSHMARGQMLEALMIAGPPARGALPGEELWKPTPLTPRSFRATELGPSLPGVMLLEMRLRESERSAVYVAMTGEQTQQLLLLLRGMLNRRSQQPSPKPH